MPRYMEAALKKKFGAKSKAPYKIMNAMGVMRGNKITAKGRAMEARHDYKARARSIVRGLSRRSSSSPV